MSTNSSAIKAKSPAKGKSAQAAPKKHTYFEMIQMALLTLNESQGSTRQEIWKYIEAQYPEADHKRYLVALKKLSHKDESTLIQGKNRARFALEKKFRSRALRRIASGQELISIIQSKAMTDPVKKKMKAKKPKKAAKKPKKKSSAGKKGSPARGSKAAAAKGKGKSDANKKTTKDKMKEKAK